MTRALAGALALVLAACGSGGDGSGDAAHVDPAASTVAIEARGCRLLPNRAVGTVVGDDLVATVAHAVAGEADIIVLTPDRRSLRGRVAAIDTGLDAALVVVEGLGLPPVPRRTYEQAEPVRLLVVGDGAVESVPVDVRRRVTVRTSDIYREGEHQRPGFELAADVVAGDSGGGLVGGDGSLLGVVWATSREEAGRAWALPIEAYEPLVAQVAGGEAAPAVPCAR